MLVALEEGFKFYSQSLDLLTDVRPNSIIDGLESVLQFKSLAHIQHNEYVMVARIRYDNLEKIVSRGIKNIYTGNSGSSHLLLEIIAKNG